MCSFISNFFTQPCCAPASHNYGNQREEKLERMNNRNVNIFLHIHTFGSMKQHIFPVNEETFKGKYKNTQTRQRKNRPLAAVSHIPPPQSCREYRHCVGCSEQEASQKASIHACKIRHLPYAGNRLSS